MASRASWMIAIGVGAIALLAVARGCGSGGDRRPVDVPAAPSVADDRGTTDAAAQGTAEAAAARNARQRDAALQSAVDTLQRYLAALGADDKAKADAYWAGGRVPARSGEADLRALRDLRAVRIENGAPKALDSGPVPDALEIPVELRVSRGDAGQQRYAGWYRLRRGISGGRWEITSASIDALPQQR